MRKCLVSHYTDKSGKTMYLCREGLTATKISLCATRCWRHNCPGLRQIPQQTVPTCNSIKCNNLVRAGSKTKYCSLKCKSRESSRLYRLKKKNESL